VKKDKSLLSPHDKGISKEKLNKKVPKILHRDFTAALCHAIRVPDTMVIS